MAKVIAVIFVSWIVCFVLHIGFGVNPTPLVWYCGLSLLGFVVYYIASWSNSRSK